MVVGGLATIAHGYSRLTGDIDLVISFAPENVRTVAAALRDVGYVPMVPVDIGQIGDEATRKSWIQDKGMIVLAFFDPKLPVLRVDLMVDPPIPFERLTGDCVQRQIYGVPVTVCSREHLIEMKEMAGRPQDLEDVTELKKKS